MDANGDIHSATGRSEPDVDNHLAKQHKVIPGLLGYWAELWRRAERGNGQAVFVAYIGLLQVGPVHDRHCPRVSYCTYIGNSMENSVASAVDVLFT